MEMMDPSQEQVAQRENKHPKPPPKRHKDDHRGNHNFQFIQEGTQNLLTNGVKRPLDGLHPKDGTNRQPCYWVHRGKCQRLHHPHNDELVVSIRVGNYNTHQVLVDNGSFADILYYPAFQQMRIKRTQLVPTNTPLVGFGGTRVYPFGAVTLPLTVNDYSQQNTKDVSFLVVDCSSTYNAILGHPTLNSMIKFPIEYEGIK